VAEQLKMGGTPKNRVNRQAWRHDAITRVMPLGLVLSAVGGCGQTFIFLREFTPAAVAELRL